LAHEHLQKWAGKNIWREAMLLAESKPRLDVETASGIAIRFVDHEIEARVLPGANPAPTKLLDGILTTASKTSHTRWVVAAVLAFHVHRGKSIERPGANLLAEVKDAPQSRADVLEAVRRLLDTMVSTGLAHPSERLQERLLTLSMSTLGVHLPRVSRLLRTIADDVTLQLRRDVKADTARLFDRLTVTLALTRALTQAGDAIPPSLAGRPRTEYEPVGDLTLVGMAAFPWHTASGFRGLTLLCWDDQAKIVRSWSTSRAAHVPGRFDLRQAYETDAIWQGGGAPTTLCRSRFVLRGARANYQGRLSASQGVSVERCEPAAPHQLNLWPIAFRSWGDLAEYARRVVPLGLAERNPLEACVVLFPTTWGRCVFDEFQQRLIWPIADDKGASLPLTAPWTPVHEEAIEFLEQVRPDRDRLVAVVARLNVDAAGLSVEPLALWSEGTPAKDHVLNPAFDFSRIQSKHSGLLDRLRAKYGRNALATTMQTDDDEADWLPPAAHFPLELEKRFGDLERLLWRWAERGVGHLSEEDSAIVNVLAHRFTQAGLGALAHAVAMLAKPDSALALLWCGYLQRTYREAQFAEQYFGSLR
jgi:hypothetical protein